VEKDLGETGIRGAIGRVEDPLILCSKVLSGSADDKFCPDGGRLDRVRISLPADRAEGIVASKEQKTEPAMKPIPSDGTRSPAEGMRCL